MKTMCVTIATIILSAAIANGMHIEYALFQNIDRDQVHNDFHKSDKEIFFRTNLEKKAKYYIKYEKVKYVKIAWERTEDGYKVLGKPIPKTVAEVEETMKQ
jgi:hypothetical protein